MNFTDQMATKLLAQATKKLSEAVNEALCASPDKRLVRALLDQVRSDLHEFEDAYFDEDPDEDPQQAATGGRRARR